MKYQQGYMTWLWGMFDSSRKETLTALRQHKKRGPPDPLSPFPLCLCCDSRRTRTPTMGTGIPRSIQLNYGAIQERKVNIFS
jgi:hypothetical protein